MLIFGATINVVPWVYGPEILPLEARSRGVAISVSAHWMWNFCMLPNTYRSLQALLIHVLAVIVMISQL